MSYPRFSLAARRLLTRSRRRALLASVGAAAVLGCAPAAVAADAASDNAASIAQITVTAERRDTKLQETPVAETAVAAATIEADRIVSLQDLALVVPSLTYTQFSRQESYFSIRGTLINNNAAGWDDAVATFIDDVPTTGLGDVNPDLFDLASIEVLRGPQGTLFGRNATGGAVLIRTQPPSFDFGAKVEATYGAYNLAELRGLVTGPLSDTVAAKLVVDLNHEDGDVNNVVLHDKTDQVNSIDVRGQLLWKPSDTLNVLFSADYLADRSGGYPTRLFGTFTPALFPNLSYSPYDTNQAINGDQHRDIAGLSARVIWESPVGTLTSITGYRYVNGRFPNTVIGDPENQLPTIGLLRDNQISQEVRLASRGDQRLTWLVGAFGLYSDKHQAAPTGFFFDPNTVAGIFSTPNDYFQNPSQRVDTTSFALFGEANYALTDQLKLTLGARLSSERKAGRSIVTYSIVNPKLFPADSSYAHTWNAFTPKATLSFQPNHNFMAYVTAAEGFKSGGFDLSGDGAGTSSAVVNAALAHPFDQETVWNYEVGEKFTGLDGRLVLDADLFDDEYHNLQTSQLVTINSIPVQITSNAGNARVAGAEVDSQFLPTDWLTLGASYSYMDAHFTSKGEPFPAGSRIPYAPKDQVHVSADVHHPLPGDAGNIDLSFDYTYHSKIFFDNGNSAPQLLQSKSVWNGIVNAHLQYTSPDNKWMVSLWGKNITATEPVLHASDVTVLFENLAELANHADSLFLVKYYPLRTFGVTVTRSF